MATNAFQLQVPQGLGNALAPQTGGIFDPLTQMVAGQQAMDYSQAVQNVNQQLQQQAAEQAAQEAEVAKRAAIEQKRQEILQAQQYKAEEAQKQRDFYALEHELTRQMARDKAAAGTSKPMTPQQEAKYRGQMGDDFKNVGTALQNATDIRGLVNDIITSPGLEARTGLSGYIPAKAQEFFGTKGATTAQNRIDTLKGKVTQIGKQIASASGALGNMAVQEWRIVSDAVQALDPTADNFEEQLANVVAQAEGIAARLQDAYDRQYSVDFEKYPQFATGQIPVKPYQPKAGESVTVGGKTYQRPANMTDAQWAGYKQAMGVR